MATGTLRALRPRTKSVAPSLQVAGPPPPGRRRRLRPWMAIPLVVALGAAAWVATRSSSTDEAATPTERVVEATSGPLARTVSASGAIEAAQVDQLS